MKQSPLSEKEFQNSLGISETDLERLRRYASLLRRWQKRINLVADSTLDDLWRRHMLDSAQLIRYLRGDEKNILDLGSGAGFPGLVLAILTALPVHLVESNARKCVFLREAARETDADITVHHARIENLEPRKFDLITARALAPLGKLLDYAAPFLAENGRCLFLKGAKIEGELTESRKKWNMSITKTESLSDSSGVILMLEGISRAHD